MKKSLRIIFLCILFLFLGVGVFLLVKNGKNHQSNVADIVPDTAVVSNFLPFGIHEFQANIPEERSAVSDLSIQHVRLSPYGNLIWDMIEKERGVYDWRVSDDVLGKADKLGVSIVVNVLPANRIDRPDFPKSGIKMPKNLDWYLEFLAKASERYDGDGIDDAPGSPKIDVIQIANEVDGEAFWKDTPENYARLLKESYEAIKKVSPEMSVGIAGVATPSGYYRFYQSIFEELKRLKDRPDERFFDVFDFHWSGQFQGDYREIVLPDGKYEMGAFLADIRQDIADLQSGEIAIYITEMSDYSGQPTNYPFQSESVQAGELVKRYVYALSAGVDAIFWTQFLEQYRYGGEPNGYFSNVGLINNPQNDGESHKKLAYFSYKKLISVLSGSDFGSIQRQTSQEGVFVYRFEKKGKALFVIWSDRGEQRVLIRDIAADQVFLTDFVPFLKSGKEVQDFDAAFSRKALTVKRGEVTVVAKGVPIFVEE